MDHNTDTILLVADDAEQLAAPPEAAPVAEVPAAPVVEAHEAVAEVPAHVARGGDYPSLYDSKATTVVAVLLGVMIVLGVQYIIERIFREAKDIHYALTRFVVSMVALLVGAYITDLLVSGPDTSLLADSEKASILDFVKSTALMIFSYFFGVKSAGAPASKED